MTRLGRAWRRWLLRLQAARDAYYLADLAGPAAESCPCLLWVQRVGLLEPAGYSDETCDGCGHRIQLWTDGGAA